MSKHTPGADGKIAVYSTVSGRKLRVPPHWMDSPELSKNLRLTPSTKVQQAAEAQQTPASYPLDDQNPDDTESPDQTPA